MPIKTGIVGAAGFTGIELVRLVLRHPEFVLAAATSDSLEGTPIASIYPAFAGKTNDVFLASDSPLLNSCDVVFLAVPHTAALSLAPALLDAGVSVIDLSADFRLDDPCVYEKWYETPHTQPQLLESRVFGLPELFKDELVAAAARFAKGEAVLISCAGCYPTATSLAAAPALRASLIDEAGVVIADAISGVSGAGKKATQRTHYCFADENVEGYGVVTHRHTPEIEQILHITGHLVFTPHLAPLKRGLLATVYLPLSSGRDVPAREELEALYSRFYHDDPFVEVLSGTLPKTASVAGTNAAHIGVSVNPVTQTIIAISAIDNLGKGAAGQAVQCANIMCGLDERSGLDLISCPV